MITKFRFQPLVFLQGQNIFGYEVLFNKTRYDAYPSATEILKSIFSQKMRNNNFMMSINMTVDDVVNPSFAKRFLQVVEDYQVDTKKIVLEVSENTAPDSIAEVKKTLSLLRYYGVKIALDDFGAQYAGIEYVSELPLDIIKVDQKFIQNAPSNSKVRSLLKCVTNMAHDIGCTVVVEGIENNSQLEIAEEINAEAGQGFLFSAPLSHIEHRRFFNMQELCMYFTKMKSQACGQSSTLAYSGN